MPAVRCVSRYSSDVAGAWEQGKEAQVSEKELLYLLKDSPDSFQLIGPPRESGFDELDADEAAAVIRQAQINTDPARAAEIEQEEADGETIAEAVSREAEEAQAAIDLAEQEAQQRNGAISAQTATPVGASDEEADDEEPETDEAGNPLPDSESETATGVKGTDRRARGGRRRKDE